MSLKSLWISRRPEYTELNFNFKGNKHSKPEVHIFTLPKNRK